MRETFCNKEHSNPVFSKEALQAAMKASEESFNYLPVTVTNQFGVPSIEYIKRPMPPKPLEAMLKKLNRRIWNECKPTNHPKKYHEDLIWRNGYECGATDARVILLEEAKKALE